MKRALLNTAIALGFTLAFLAAYLQRTDAQTAPPPSTAPVASELVAGIDNAVAVTKVHEENGSLADYIDAQVQGFHAYAMALPPGEVKDAVVNIDSTANLLQLDPLAEKVFEDPNYTPTAEDYDSILDWLNVLRSTVILAEKAQGN